MRAWGSVALVCATAMACSSSVTGTGGSSSSGGSSSGASSSGASSSGAASSGSGSSCMLVYTDRTCQSQLESSCCAPSQACRDDSDCFALVGCVQTCNRDTSCESTCYGDHSSGLGDYDSLQSCIAENLGANCQFY